jgi:hypothetical protein
MCVVSVWLIMAVGKGQPTSCIAEHRWVGDLVDALEEYGSEIVRQELEDEVARTITAGVGPA